MKLAQFNIENNIAEFHNSIWGVESVKLNGREISKGYSTFGKDHIFSLDEDTFNIRPYFSFRKLGCVGITIYKNGLPLSLENKLSVKHKRKLWFKYLGGIFFGLLVGGAFGWLLGYSLVNMFTGF